MKMFLQRIATIVLLVILLWPLSLYAQPREIIDALTSISKVTSGRKADNTTMLLREANFEIPEFLKQHWDKFSAYRKLETAFWVAEQAGPGNGQKLIAFLFKRLGREFESVSADASATEFLRLPDEMPMFASPATIHLPATVSTDISKSIITITKYTDAKALGGTHGILKYYFDLPDEVVVKLLRESATDFDALIRGIELASIPPEKKERLVKILTDLRENYLTANMDQEIVKILDMPDFIVEKPGATLHSEPQREKLRYEYDHFLHENYPTPESKKFKTMRRYDRGFGGVILGNKISQAKNIGKLKQIVWIHEQDANGINYSGHLEFWFADNIVKRLPGILWEDIYAAYNIIYVDNKNLPLNKGDGIGLIGADYPKVYSEDRVYDSLIKSFRLTSTELAYYNLLSDWEKFIIGYKARVNKLNKTAKNIEEIDRQMDDLQKKIKEYGSSYEKMLELGQILEIQRKEEITKYRATYSEFQHDSILYENYIKSNRIFKAKYPKETVSMMNYISYCNKAVLYPVIANLQLGRSLYRCDILPRIGPALIQKMQQKGATEEEIKACKQWLRGTDSIGWKFSDDSLQISFDKNFLQVQRINKQMGDGFVIFNAITTDKKRQNISQERPEFCKVLPALTRVFYDYHRLNNFVKLMAVVRWAKQNGAVFLNKPTPPPLCKAPIYSKLTENGEVIFIDRE
ncbi:MULTISPECIES: hypothetical protein [Niastella]|uniref:Uncharacterized protein n=1 Tax=Niastella soli TaxID=2821487 RepID=A0ABS3YYQ7_9BACT|nr:hypothetical protein [Niastella soli]MBO9203056.1 hypothetical protein [Niastella soli]